SPEWSNLPKKRTRSYWSGVALLIALWLALAAWIAWDHRTEVKALHGQAETLVRAVAEHTDRVLWEADQLAASIALAMQRQGIDIPLANYFDLGLAKFDVFLQISITDSAGILRASTTPGFQPVDLSDREHVRVHMGRDIGRDI